MIDSEGNEYYEVPYLAQDTVFEEIENTGATDPELQQYNQQTPYLLKLKRSSRRFVSRFKTNNELEIQFSKILLNFASKTVHLIHQKWAVYQTLVFL